MLSTTKNLNSINYTILPTIFESQKKLNTFSLYDMLLANENELITLKYTTKIYRSLIDTTDFATKKNLPHVNIQNKIVTLDKYQLIPIHQFYKFNILSNVSMWYYTIADKLPENRTVTVIQTIGPWEIVDGNLELYFDLAEFLQKNNNCKVKTIFMYFDYGIEQTYKIGKYNYDYQIINCNELSKTDIKFKTDDIVIEQFKLLEMINCASEINTLPLLLYIFNFCLKNLSLGGSLYYAYNLYVLKPTFQLFSIIRSLFESVDYYDNTLDPATYGFLHFINYKKKDNKLSKYVKEYAKIDPFFGQTNFVINEKPIFCVNSNKNRKKNNNKNNNILIKSFKKQEVDKDFVIFINNIYENKNKIIDQMIKRISLKKSIHTVITNMVSVGIDFCKKYNLKINDIYRDFKPINHKEFIKEYFLEFNGVNLNNIQINLDSNFSITRPSNTRLIAKYILSMNKNINYVIDGNANIGSTAIILSQYFKKVDAVEINKQTFLKLKNNIKQYHLTNVTVYNDDIIKFVKKVKKDYNTCLFLDPPWSGIFYKSYDIIDLYFDQTDVLDFIIDCPINYICMKAPYNFNMSKLYRLFNNVSIHKVPGFYIILIIK